MRSQRLIFVVLFLCFSILSVGKAKDYVLIVGGVAGEKSYYDRFWKTSFQFYELLTLTYDLNPDQVTFLFEQSAEKTVTDKSTAENVISAFHTIYISATPNDRFILLMLGHANQSGSRLKFNLPGRDLFAQEYANMIRQIRSKTKILFFDFPYSGQMIPLLPHRDTIVITSCSSKEGNASSGFGQILLNQFRKNPAQSLLGIMNEAQIDIQNWYKQDGSVQTAHPQIKGVGLDQIYLGQPIVELTKEAQRNIISAPFSLNQLRTLAEQPEISSSVIWSQDTFNINEDSSYTHNVRRTIRIMTEHDYQLGQVSIPYTRGNDDIEISYGRTVLTCGRIIDLDPSSIKKGLMPPGTIEAGMFVDARLVQFELPQMEKGCVIDYFYTRKNRGHLLEGEFWRQIYVQEHVRVNHYELTISLPYQKQLHYQFYSGRGQKPNLLVQPKINTSSYTTTYQFKLEDLPALTYEPFMPDKKDLAYSIAVSTIPSWQPLVEWYSTLIREQDQTNSQIQNKVQELTSGAFSKKEKIRRLYNFVTNEISYVGIELGIWAIKPHPSPRIFQEKHGDCKDKSTLLSTMLAEVDIPSYPVLISAGKSRYVNRKVPSLAYFNHMILAVKMRGDNFLFLDPTASGQPFDQLPVSDQNRWVMIINPDANETPFVNQPLYHFDKTPLQHNNQQIITTSVQVEENQTIIVNQEIRFFGHFNTIVRQHAPNQNGSKTEFFFRDLLELTDEIEISQLRFLPVNSYESRLIVNWRRPKHLIGLGHQFLLELPCLPLKYDQLLKSHKRTSPISLPTTINVQQTCKINLAKSFQMAQTPEDQHLLIPPIGSFQLAVKSSKRRISMVSTFMITETLILANNFQQLQSLLEARQEVKRILLSKR